MKEQKNIDRLFQEKFKDFEVHPSDKVWSKIAETQKKVKGRKVIPFWWKFGSVAAASIVLVTVGSLLLNNGEKANPKFVNQETIQDENNNNLETLPPENKNINKSTIQQNNINVAEINSSTETKEEENLKQQNNFNNVVNTNAVVTSSAGNNNKQQSLNNLNNSNDKGGEENSKQQNNFNNLVNTNTVASSSTGNNNKQQSLNNLNNSNDKVGEENLKQQNNSNNVVNTNTVATSSTGNNNKQQSLNNSNDKGGVNSLRNKNTQNTAITNSNKNTVAYNNSSQNKDKRFIKQTTDNNNTTLKNSNSEKDNTVITNDKNTVIALSENDNKKDLTVEAQKIEDLKNEEEVIAQIDLDKASKWNVGAIAAPVYYGDFGGSGVDNQFSNNSKTGDVNLSYGVQISYEVTPKLKVRTGVSTVDLSYSTNGVSFSTSGQGRSLSSVNFANDVETLVIADRGTQEIISSFISEPNGTFGNGSLEQQFNYIEVPMEAVYTISDKRIGFSVIGGVSTLLLNDNKISLVSDEVTTTLGESSAVNDVSFSTNIGIGIDYKMTDKLQLNVEPSFKYQINGFDSDAVDFNPYYLGVYTGISYKF